MQEAPSWSEVAQLLDRLAEIAAGQAGVARAARTISDKPEAREQLQQALDLLSSGQDNLAKALRQVANLFSGMGTDEGQAN